MGLSYAAAMLTVACDCGIDLHSPGPIQDVEICTLAIRDAGDKIAQHWRYVLMALNIVRRWAFLPGLVAVTPMLVVTKGGDSLSVCFNSVALLFICEMDNLAYELLLPGSMRAQVDEEGRVQMEQVKELQLVWSKIVHVVLVVLAIPSCLISVVLRGRVAIAPPFITFLLAGTIEVFIGNATGTQACKKVVTVAATSLLGVVLFFGLALAIE